MTLRYEDAASPLVVRWEDAQPDKGLLGAD